MASDMRPRFEPKRGHRLPQTLEEYTALFAGAQSGQRVGEASPSYLYSQTAAARIAELAPAARSIAILREPTAFLRSLHLQLLGSHVETERDLRRALELEPARAEGRSVPRRSHLPQLLLYSQHVRYADQLRRYHDVFPREQVLVLIYDDFRADNQATLEQVMRFLDVDAQQPLEQIEIKHTRRAIRSQRADDMLHAVTLGTSPLARAARATVKAVTSRDMRRGAVTATRSRVVLGDVPPADEDLMLELRRRFKPEVQAASEYLGRDLVALWGYDSLD
jgi:hypothetical protein